MSHPSPPTGSAAASSHYFSNRSLTFELLYKSWPSFHSHLHSLIPLAQQRCLYPFLFFTFPSTYFLPCALSERLLPSPTFLYLWGKVNLSMMAWTAPRFTLPSLSSNCRSSCDENKTISKKMSHFCDFFFPHRKLTKQHKHNNCHEIKGIRVFWNIWNQK